MSLVVLLLSLACAPGDKPGPGAADDTGCEPQQWFADADGDGFGAGAPVDACSAPDAHVGVAGDCDDTDPAVHPDAAETCNGIDDDCDGVVDPADEVGELTCYIDADGDGWGSGGATLKACACPDAYAERDGDCDDGDATVSPDAVESWYDGVDQDCAGDDDFDADGDGFDLDADCDDEAPGVNPDAAEICGNGVDDDCDGLAGACGITDWMELDDADVVIRDDGRQANLVVLDDAWDHDGDGDHELLVARTLPGDELCRKESALLEFHLVSLGGSGEFELDTRSKAMLDAAPGCGDRISGAPAGVGRFDLDGDGHRDLVVSLPYSSTSESLPQVRFVPGPIASDASLSDAPFVTGTAFPRSFSTSRLDVAIEQGVVVFATGHSSSTSTSTQDVWFFTLDNFSDGGGDNDASRLVMDSDESFAVGFVDDIDGDGIEDLGGVWRDAPDWSRSFLHFYGPLDHLLESGDADLVIANDDGELQFDPRQCPGADGGVRVVGTFQPAGDADAELRFWNPTAGVSLGPADAVATVQDAAAFGPTVVECAGDLDADGSSDMVLTPEDVSRSGADPVVALAAIPAEGVWSLADLVWAGAEADASWSAQPASSTLGDADFDGDGADDLVFSVKVDVDRGGASRDEREQVFFFSGGATGF